MLQRTIPRGKIVTDCRNYSSPVSLHPFHFPLLSNEFHQYTISDTTFFLETQERITLFYSFLPLFISFAVVDIFFASVYPAQRAFSRNFSDKWNVQVIKKPPVAENMVSRRVFPKCMHESRSTGLNLRRTYPTSRCSMETSTRASHRSSSIMAFACYSLESHRVHLFGLSPK